MAALSPSAAPFPAPSKPAAAARPQFSTLILDANAIIGAGVTSLAGLAGKYVTAGVVLDELRDTRARSALATLLFTLDTRRPPESSVSAVREFAKKTGDLARLSGPDIAILALAHQAEREANGGTFLRPEPLSVVTGGGWNGGGPVSASVGTRGPCRFFHSPGGCRAGPSCPPARAVGPP